MQPKFGFDKFYRWLSAFISIRKEVIKKIQMDSRSKNDAPSSDKKFLFKKLITCQQIPETLL
jgi:hypothetical protein